MTSWALALALLRPAHAAAKKIEASGTVKELWQYSRSAANRRPYFLNTARARLTLDASAGIARAHAEYDHELLAGSYFRTREHGLTGSGDPPTWLEPGAEISTGDTSLWRHRLHRGWAGIDTGPTAVRFGRQRLAWGVGKLWNPTDVLTPYRPNAIERDEPPGVDALTLRQELGELAQGELAWAPENRWPRHSLLGRLKWNWRSVDLAIMGGKTPVSSASFVAGGEAAGALAQGTLRGEWTYADPRHARPAWKLAAGYDYTFAGRPGLLKDLAVSIEYHHNGAGTTGVFRYDPGRLLSGREVALAKDYAGLTLSKDLHPLVKLEWTTVANLDDASSFTAPALVWNALKDLHLTAGFQRFSGARRTEFGRVPNLGFLQAQYFF